MDCGVHTGPGDPSPHVLRQFHGCARAAAEGAPLRAAPDLRARIAAERRQPSVSVGRRWIGQAVGPRVGRTDGQSRHLAQRSVACPARLPDPVSLKTTATTSFECGQIGRVSISMRVTLPTHRRSVFRQRRPSADATPASASSNAASCSHRRFVHWLVARRGLDGCPSGV